MFGGGDVEHGPSTRRPVDPSRVRATAHDSRHVGGGAGDCRHNDDNRWKKRGWQSEERKKQQYARDVCPFILRNNKPVSIEGGQTSSCQGLSCYYGSNFVLAFISPRRTNSQFLPVSAASPSTRLVEHSSLEAVIQTLRCSPHGREARAQLLLEELQLYWSPLLPIASTM